jgi:Ca2+-transporting ATPase
MSDAELCDQAPHVAAYARVTAEDKLRIVRAFKATGAVVAMTGDGVNDAPALREASIGVAMGRTGTEVTREASDMVVTDDNFASIVAAVEEGRGIYDNIRKCLQYLLAGNSGEILIMLAAAVVGWPVPLLPLQILWINLVTDGLPALALAADPVDPQVLRQPPRPPEAELADRPFFVSVAVTGALTAGVALAAFAYGHYVQHSVAAARNYAFSTLVFAELLRSFGARSPVHTIWQPGAGPNHRLTAVVLVSIVLQVAIHHVPFLQRLFDLEPLGVLGTVLLLLLGAVPLLLLELQKLRSTIGTGFSTRMDTD